MLTRTSRGLALAAATTAALGALAACGTSSASKTSSLPPKDAITTAYTNLLDSDALTATLKIDESAADLVAISKAGTDPDPLTQEQATAIANGTIVIAEKVDKGTLGQSTAASGAATALTINAGDDPKLIEIRYIDKQAYARADVPQFVKYGAVSQSQLDQLTGPSAPSQAAFLKDAVAGKWLKLPLQDALDAVGGSTGAVPSVAPSQVSGLQNALKNVFSKDVTSTKSGTDAKLGDEYVLTGSTQQVGTDLVTAVKTQLSSIPGADKVFSDADPAKIANKNVTVQAFVKNNKLDALKLDVAQFLTGDDLATLHGKPFFIELDFDNSADVTTPTGATTVTFGSLIALFSSVGNDTSSGAGASSGAL